MTIGGRMTTTDIPLGRHLGSARRARLGRDLGIVSSLRRHDPAHHHPQVYQTQAGDWEWECRCGGHAPRVDRTCAWRVAIIEALCHATELA